MLMYFLENASGPPVLRGSACMLALLACFLGLGVVGGGDVTARTAGDRLAGSWAVQFPLASFGVPPKRLDGPSLYRYHL